MTPIDPTYARDLIDKNPVWKLAWRMSELANDHAPIGWSRYVPIAQQSLDNAREVLAKIENLRVAMSHHGSGDFRLGALYAIDSVTKILRRPPE